ncbi:MAG TPA: LCP family protein [Cryobacterium sp.]|nr:LCP family protein [Cryobacterium sp.]
MPDTAERSGARAAWRITVILFALAVLAAGAVVAVPLWNISQLFDGKVEKISHAFPWADAPRPPALQGEAAKAQNILILGSDTRGSLSGSLVGIGGQRSDTIMVVHVPADRKHVYVMSILRDSWLSIPGHGQAKINAALSWGGVPLAVQTVEGLLDVRIDHVAVVDFDGFEGATDALGGVTIDNPVDFTSSKLAGHRFAKGKLHLNGTQALAFARERDAYRDGDFQRVRNQQLLLKALLGNLVHGGSLFNLGRLGGLLGAVAPHLAVDEGLTLGYLATSGLELRSIRPADVTFFTVPTDGTGTSADGQSIVNLDWNKLTAVKKAFQTDTLGGYKPEFQSIG